MEKLNTTTATNLHDASHTTLAGIGENVVYLMGFSFVLGSLFTILILILLDFMRRNTEKRSPQ